VLLKIAKEDRRRICSLSIPLSSFLLPSFRVSHRSGFNRLHIPFINTQPIPTQPINSDAGTMKFFRFGPVGTSDHCISDGLLDNYSEVNNKTNNISIRII
jgi:hypothetical protein